MLQDFQKNYMNIKKPAKSGFDPKTLGKDFTTYLKREYQNLNLKSRACSGRPHSGKFSL